MILKEVLITLRFEVDTVNTTIDGIAWKFLYHLDG